MVRASCISCYCIDLESYQSAEDPPTPIKVDTTIEIATTEAKPLQDSVAPPASSSQNEFNFGASFCLPSIASYDIFNNYRLYGSPHNGTRPRQLYGYAC